MDFVELTVRSRFKSWRGHQHSKADFSKVEGSAPDAVFSTMLCSTKFDTPSALCYQKYTMPTDLEVHAWQRLQEAYQAQIAAYLHPSAQRYHRSLALHPTP